MMEPETIAYIVVAVLVAIKLVVYLVYRKVIKQTNQKPVKQGTQPNPPKDS